MTAGRAHGKRQAMAMPSRAGAWTRHPGRMLDERFLRRAIALPCSAIGRPGSEPFAAVVVKDGAIVGEGLNHAAAHHDPTSHGETEATRDACRRLGILSLAGCGL